MSLLRNWLNTSEGESPARENPPKVYNTFNDQLPSSTFFPANYLSRTTSQGSLSNSSDSVNIEIFETYNTAGTMLPSLRESQDLQPLGYSSSSDFTKCCKICRKLYKEEENGEGACRFHRGKFQGSAAFTSVATLKRWSCCLNEQEHGEGCTFGLHKEDPRVTGILKTFDNAKVEDKRENGNLSKNKGSKKQDFDFDLGPKVKKEVPVVKRETRSKEVVHDVEKGDTLQGLAVKYNVAVADIKRANKLFGDQIFGRKVLKIPPEKQES